MAILPKETEEPFASQREGLQLSLSGTCQEAALLGATRRPGRAVPAAGSGGVHLSFPFQFRLLLPYLST